MRMKAFRSMKEAFRLWLGCAALAVVVALPPVAQAQNVCNGSFDINYLSGQPYGLVGDVYRVEVGLGAGSITGGALNKLTVNRFRFQLDCSNFAFVGCTDEGDIIRYVGDGTITSSNCLDAGSVAVAWSSNGVDSPLGPNQVVFTPSNPVVLAANTLPGNGCKVAFDVRIQTAPGLDASPTIVQEASGYDPFGPPFDAVCDNGLNASTSQSGQLFLCPQCADGECFDQACNQTTGMCDQTNESSSTPCTDTDGQECTTAGCDGQGACDQQHIFLDDSTPCTDTDSNECTTAGCDGAGTCEQDHQVVTCNPPIDPECDAGETCNTTTGQCETNYAQASQPCTDTDGKECTVAGCNGLGACDQNHILLSGTPCGDPADTDCTNPDTCDGAGNCLNNHEPNSTQCTDTDGKECTTAGCDGQGACDQNHILVPNSTQCTDTDGKECTTAGCDGQGACDQNHILEPESTACSEADDNECTIAGCDDVGSCDQSHAFAPEGTPCEINGECDGFGECQFTPPPNDHFKCYKTRQLGASFAKRSVTLEDQFGTTNSTVLQPRRFCNPADKNDEGVKDPTAHMMCYKIREPRFQPRVVVVENQFGEQTLTVLRPYDLCVPAEKDGVPSELNMNHFKCYRIAQGLPGFQEREVDLEDQFETKATAVRRPRLLCNPVDKDGEGIIAPDNHLVCYSIRDVKGQPAFQPQQVEVTDQFAEQGLSTLRGDCRKGSYFCVPSTKRIPSPSGAFLDPTSGVLD